LLEIAPIGRGPLGEDNDAEIVVTGLVPVIHVGERPETLGVAGNGATWMAGTSPAMAEKGGMKAFSGGKRRPPITHYL
jgi:hypothetical protein